jgi:hypothetical protein
VILQNRVVIFDGSDGDEGRAFFAVAEVCDGDIAAGKEGEAFGKVFTRYCHDFEHLVRVSGETEVRSDKGSARSFLVRFGGGGDIRVMDDGSELGILLESGVFMVPWAAAAGFFEWADDRKWGEGMRVAEEFRGPHGKREIPHVKNRLGSEVVA